MWSESCGQGNQRLVSKSEWSWMVWTYAEEGDECLGVALDLEVKGQRKQGLSKKIWKKEVEEETEKIGLKNDAQNQAKWRD